jgi:hypothetical protein
MRDQNGDFNGNFQILGENPKLPVHAGQEEADSGG